MLKIGTILYISHAFYQVWPRARKHRKLRHFSAARKSNENTKLLHMLSVIVYCSRVFDMFLMYFLTVERMIFDHAKKQANYNDKLRRVFAPRNASAIELHFVCQICTFHRDLSLFHGVRNNGKTPYF